MLRKALRRALRGQSVMIGYLSKEEPVSKHISEVTSKARNEWFEFEESVLEYWSDPTFNMQFTIACMLSLVASWCGRLCLCVYALLCCTMLCSCYVMLCCRWWLCLCLLVCLPMCLIARLWWKVKTFEILKLKWKN